MPFQSKLLTVNGVTKSYKQWSNETGLSRGIVWQRIHQSGWTPEKAVSCKCRMRRNQSGADNHAWKGGVSFSREHKRAWFKEWRKRNPRKSRAMPEHLLKNKRRPISNGLKRCRTCKIEKELTEFRWSIRRNRPRAHPEPQKYYNSDCNACAPEVNRLRLYGATLSEMIAKQGTALCPLCLNRMADSLDHDHKTGKPRGALCRKCNLIMHYMDNAEWVARAKDYIYASSEQVAVPLSEHEVRTRLG